MKTNLFSRFRNLFRRSEPDYEDTYEEDYEGGSDVIAEDPLVEQEEVGAEAEPAWGGEALQMPRGAAVPERNPQVQGIHVPLAPIVAGMPIELQSRLLHEVGDLSVFLPLDQILPQLSRGVVSLTFGELRSAAPKVFVGNRDQDEVLVNVPLSAILPHVSPNMLARRHGPLQLEIPEDIVSPFADKGNGLAIGSVKPTLSAASVPLGAAPQHAPIRPAAPAHTPVPRPAPQPAEHLSPRPASQPSAPSTSLARPALSRPGVVPMPSQRSTPTPASQQGLPDKPVSALGSTPARPGLPLQRPRITAPTTDNGTAIIGRAAVAPQAASTPQPEHAPAAATENRPPLVVPIGDVADAWPDGLKQEVIQQNLTRAQLAIPYGLVESGLKRGRLVFTWKTLRSWLRPPATVDSSLHDAVEVEFPLRVVAPLFITQQKARPRQSTQVPVDKDIPNLFTGLPRPDTAGVAVDHSVTKPLDTNYYIWDDREDAVAEDRGAATASHDTSAGTAFVRRYATPNEVVSRAAGLDGVAGAVIALPDGLMVANHLPPGVNGDTLAAFLPQLFSKVTQCTQELRMGELNNLNFTVGNVPWKIFRVNALYFAAFGTKGEALPTARLAALAAELDHKAKV